jgi:hypothetical protein
MLVEKAWCERFVFRSKYTTFFRHLFGLTASPSAPEAMREALLTDCTAQPIAQR